MKTRKKIAIGCGSFIALGVMGVMCILAIIAFNQRKYDKLAFPFFEEAIPVISQWETASVKVYWAPEILPQLKEDKVARLFKAYERLGVLESYETPIFQQVSATTTNPYGTIVKYGISAEYENGSAYITCELVPTKSDGLKIWMFKINSDVFLDQLEPETSTQ